MSDTPSAPVLAGIHHLKLPVTDLQRSIEWYSSRLGYRLAFEFVEQGRLMGVSLRHPNGGPDLALRLDLDRAVASAGFDYFSFWVPDKEAIDDLAAHLDELGETHAGVIFASIGWVLPHLHDPDGHELRFYTLQTHTDYDPDEVVRIGELGGGWSESGRQPVLAMFPGTRVTSGRLRSRPSR
jgi:catechol 2,3-dioxygenase-like lactoylglutathione lyase family enzyme